MLRQTFVATPIGLIKSGNADYSIDETKVVDGKVTGLANYDLFAGFFIFTKELKGQAAFKLDESQLLSANVKKGQILRVGDCHLTVVSVIGTVATLSIALTNNNGALSGIANLDLSKKYVAISYGKITGKVLGYDVTLEITPG